MKYAIVTGGNTGLGFSVAQRLLESGEYHVVIACRDEKRATEAVQKLQTNVPAATTQVEYMLCDLGNQTSVRNFVETYKAKGYPLHALVNNAGVYGIAGTNEQGVDKSFAVNHLGHFLLTLLLVDLLEASGQGRIIVVSSMLHRSVPNDTTFPPSTTMNGRTAYNVSKLANVMFASYLAPLLKTTTINSCSPGWIPTTDISRNMPTPVQWFMTNVFTLFPITRTIAQGTDVIAGLVLRSDIQGVTGKYMDKGCDWGETSDISRDAEKQKLLWKVSCQLTGLSDWENK
ncbi:hypothetical protein DFS34DRAFT_644088 [Phlyctochytrium arcticum]|nr:hypothetical protein DFS34DRAFT_644088 [Phlyctochytrium arcticum]